MKMRKIISVLASLSLSASCFVALATSASAAIEGASAKATISVDATKITDYTGEYADYSWAPDMGCETYLLTFNVTDINLATTKTGMGGSKASGTSISNWTLKYTVTTAGEKDTDWMLVDKSTMGTEIMNTWVGNTHTLSYGNGSAMIYPTTGGITVTPTDKIPVYTAIAVFNPANAFTIDFSGCTVLISKFANNTYTGNQEDNVEYDQSKGTVIADSVVLPKSSGVAVTGVTLDKSALTITKGKTATLTATVAPDNATDKTVTWETSDADVATVENGTVTAKKVGTATITAKAGDKSATCTVTVTNSGVKIAENAYYVESELTGLTNDAKFVIKYGDQSKEIQQTLGQILNGAGIGSITGKLHFAIKPVTVEASELDFTKFVIETK